MPWLSPPFGHVLRRFAAFGCTHKLDAHNIEKESHHSVSVVSHGSQKGAAGSGPPKTRPPKTTPKACPMDVNCGLV